jgi:hypothetical protein
VDSVLSLSSCTGLDFLEITEVENDCALSQLPSTLSHLAIEVMSPSTFMSISSLINLTTLRFESSRLSEFHNFVHDIKSGSFYDLKALVGCSKLENLYIMGVSLSNHAAFSHLRSLVILDTPHSNLEDLAVLSGCESLKSLNLHCNDDVVDLEPLGLHTGLVDLDLVDIAGVSDLMSLSKCTNLSSLRLSGTSVRDVSPLSFLTRLLDLDLHSTLVEDVSPLGHLVGLRSLDLSSTPVLKNLCDSNVLRDLSSLLG